MAQTVLDKQTGNQVFFPSDHTSSDEVERAMNDFNSGSITQAPDDWYTKFIKRPLQQMDATITDPILMAKSALGGAATAIQPVVPFKISPNIYQKQAFQALAPGSFMAGNLGGTLPVFYGLELATGGAASAALPILAKVPALAEIGKGLSVAKEAGVISQEGIKVAEGVAKFGATMGEYGALSSASEQKDTYGDIDWSDVGHEAAKQAAFGVATGGVLSYIAKPLAELGTAQEVVTQKSKEMLASGGAMFVMAKANGASDRDATLAAGQGMILHGLHLYGEYDSVRKASIDELQSLQARYLLSQIPADETVAIRIAEENTANHAENIINESNNGVIDRNPNPAVVPADESNVIDLKEEYLKAAAEVKQQNKGVEPTVPESFTDGHNSEMLDYLAQFIPAKAVAQMSGEERLSLANGPWQDLRDLSIKYQENPAMVDFPRPILNDKASVEPSPDKIANDAALARGGQRSAIEEVASSKVLTTELVNTLTKQVVGVEGTKAKPVEENSLTPEVNNPEDIKQFAIDNKDSILQSYANKHGNLISNDMMKKEFASVGYTGENSIPYQSEAGKLTKEYFDRKLEEINGNGDDVVLLTGGTGTGKSTLIDKLPKDNLIFDVNLTKPEMNEKLVQQIIDSGNKPVITFVVREPKKAFLAGVVKRAVEKSSVDFGRIIGVDEHLQIHEQARKTFEGLVDKFGDQVEYKIIDNRGSEGNPKEITIADLKKIGYNYEEINKELKSNVQSRTDLTESQRKAFLRPLNNKADGGKSASEQTPKQRVLGQGSEESGNAGKPTTEVSPSNFTPEEKPLEGTGAVKESGLSQSVEAAAIHKGLVDDLGDLPSYKTRDMAEIAKQVDAFITKDPELAKKIALGEAPEQDGLRAQELFTGLKIKAEKEGDVNALRDLALSDKASTMATELGQRVKALDSRSEDSPIEAIKEVKKAREDALVKKSKSKNIESQKKEIIKEIKKEVKKNAPTKETWKSFVDALQC